MPVKQGYQRGILADFDGLLAMRNAFVWVNALWVNALAKRQNSSSQLQRL